MEPRSLPGYTLAPSQQAAATQAMHRRGKRAAGLFITLFFVWAIALGAGLLGHIAVTVTGLVLFAALLVPAIVQVIPAKPPVCANCKRRMRIEWRPVGKGRDGRFAVCERCRRYIDTLWTSR